MKKNTVISLDPIDRKKKKGVIQRFLITRYGGGKSIKKMDKFGHYMFCGRQGAGKTASAIWYGEKLAKKYTKRGYTIQVYSNIGIGKQINKKTLFNTINNLEPAEKEIRIVIIDEIQTYYPREGMGKEDKEIKNKLISLFSQLRKRSTYILSTAQVYGRLDKSLREQCLYMINCKNTLTNKLINEFIDGDDIICDELGRWAGEPRIIYKHGLAKSSYNTKKIIIE